MSRTKTQIEARRVRRKNRKFTAKIRDYRLYVLLLEDDKYYVGLTAHKDVRTRYEQHAEGIGAKWTALHKPLRIIETKELGTLQEKDACLLEDELTLYYIEKYGVAKVRGGSMCAVDENVAYKHYDSLYSRVYKTKKTPPEQRIEEIDKIIERLTKERVRLVAGLLPK